MSAEQRLREWAEQMRTWVPENEERRADLLAGADALAELSDLRAKAALADDIAKHIARNQGEINGMIGRQWLRNYEAIK